MNYTAPADLQAVTLTRQILGSVNYVLGLTIGNGLYAGIIHYEHFGGDPQKRTVLNSLTAYGCAMLCCHQLVTGTVTEAFFMEGPVGGIPALIHIVARMFTSVGMFLAWTEQVVIKWLMVFRWKNAAVLSDDFFALFFKLFNVMIASGMCVCNVVLGLVYHTNYSLLSGESIVIPAKNQSANFVERKPLLTVLFTLGTFCAICFVMIKIKKFRHKRRDVVPQQPDQLQYNNETRNESIVTYGYSTGLLCLILLAASPFFLTGISGESQNQLKDILIYYREVFIQFVVSLLMSGFIYAKNKGLRDHLFKLFDDETNVYF